MRRVKLPPDIDQSFEAVISKILALFHSGESTWGIDLLNSCNVLSTDVHIFSLYRVRHRSWNDFQRLS